LGKQIFEHEVFNTECFAKNIALLEAKLFYRRIFKEKQF